MGAYNATVRSFEGGNVRSHFVAAVEFINGRWQMLSSNSLQCTGFEGKYLKADAAESLADLGAEGGDAAYDVYYRAMHPGHELRFAVDGCEYYRSLFAGEQIEPEWVV